MAGVEELPERVLFGLAWRFDGAPYEDREAFERAVGTAQEEVGEGSWQPEAVVIRRGTIRVAYSSTDPEVPYDYVPRRLEVRSADGRSFTAGELLLQLHNAVVAELRDADHRYFEGLELTGLGDDGVAQYEVRQGS